MLNLEQIARQLIKAGLNDETPAAAIHAGSMPEQQKVISTLSELDTAVKQAELKSPVIIIVGEVVRLSEELDWYQDECANRVQNVDDEIFDYIRA